MKKIISTTNAPAAIGPYSQAIDCLAAAKSFLNDSSRIALSCLALEKLSAYARHYACKHFPRRSGHPGRQNRPC